MVHTEEQENTASGYPVLRGVVPTVLTPFKDDLSIDFASLRCLIDDYARNGVQGILVPVVASEVDKLSPQERIEVTQVAVDAARGRFPVIGGILADSPEAAALAAEAAIAIGCTGLVCRAPSSINQTDDMILLRDYYTAACSTGELFVLQDLAFNDFGLPLELIAHLFETLPGFRAIKVEVVRTGYKATKILEMTGHRLDVWSGWAALQMIEGLDRGIKVFNISAYNRVFIEICDRYFSGDRAGAITRFEQILPYLAFGRQHSDINLTLTKRYLVKRGLFRTSLMRQPCIEYDEIHRQYGDEIIDRMIEWESQPADQGGETPRCFGLCTFHR
jgi:4-hydroxy-tetrahydrodipicolinate synthase